jgi:hypothetical protein
MLDYISLLAGMQGFSRSANLTKTHRAQSAGRVTKRLAESGNERTVGDEDKTRAVVLACGISR